MNWLEPWNSIDEESQAEAAVSELKAEVGGKHPMFGVRVKAIACRCDCDDVLFEFLDESGRLAVVHLTYAQRPETDSRWPSTEIFESWQDFVERRMALDHEDWTA